MIKLEAGKKYVDRQGSIWGPLKHEPLLHYCYTAPSGRTWDENGNYDIDKPNFVLDLVAEYVEDDLARVEKSVSDFQQAPSILSRFEQAISKVNDERGSTYGHPMDDFASANDLMNHFDHVEPPELRHAYRMICVKLARLKTSPRHLDSLIDVVGYVRCAIMILDRLQQRVPDKVLNEAKGEA